MQFPDLYWFPPFFTRQPASETRTQQIKSWIDLILQYCAEKNIFVLTLSDAGIESSELFRNKSINRRLKYTFALEICKKLEDQERAKCKSKGDASTRVLVYHQPFSELVRELKEHLQAYRDGQVHPLADVASGISRRSILYQYPLEHLYELLLVLRREEQRENPNSLKVIPGATLDAVKVVYNL